MKLFCRTTPTGRLMGKVKIGPLLFLVLRPTHFTMSGLHLGGYISSVQGWSKRKPMLAYLVEGRAADGAAVYRCEEFNGFIEDRFLGTDIAPVVGTVVVRDGELDVAFHSDLPQRSSEAAA